MAKRLILDTDIGTDVDDCLALALILGSPELELTAVTVVYGDVDMRARMVLKLLQLRGVQGVPVALGASKPLLGKRPIYWAGHEGQGLLAPEDVLPAPTSEHAVDLIVRSVMEAPGQITLVAVGPLTNVALACLREPSLPCNLAGLVIMGGVVGGVQALHLPWTEHNMRSDPEAAHVVVSSFPGLRIVPLDVTTQVRIDPEDVQRIRVAGDAYHQALAGQISLYPPFARRGWTYLHDPLAAATAIDPSLVTFEPVRAVIETGGEHTAGKLLVCLPSEEAANAEVALSVDVGRSRRFMLERIAGS
jgi:purine nucleosidase